MLAHAVDRSWHGGAATYGLISNACTSAQAILDRSGEPDWPFA